MVQRLKIEINHFFPRMNIIEERRRGVRARIRSVRGQEGQDEYTGVTRIRGEGRGGTR